MEKKNPTLTVIGAIIGAVLLYLVIQAALGHLNDGVAQIEAEEAASVEAAAGGAETAAITGTAGLTGTVAETSALTGTTAMSGTAMVTATGAVTGSVAGTAAETGAPAAGAAPQASDAVVAVVAKGTCNACHVIPGVPGAVGVVGPDLSNIGTAAAEREPGVSAEDYLHESIMDPNAFIAPECPFGACVPGAMPATLATTLTPEEINTVIQYLLTLHGGG